MEMSLWVGVWRLGGMAGVSMMVESVESLYQTEESSQVQQRRHQFFIKEHLLCDASSHKSDRTLQRLYYVMSLLGTVIHSTEGWRKVPATIFLSMMTVSGTLLEFGG